ncbi:MAG: helix-turn-helix transcriptional regulator [Bacteroidales bacterium]|nr:helix-turn-helix transcriptional regulator [Bacteroidales bacterium]
MEDIKDRLAHILRAKNLTASQFAELMEIQPSNVSHLLNGRNKPSLDFLIKIKDVFPEYSFDWIIMGKKPITINEPNPTTTNNQEIKFDDEDTRVIEFDDIDEHIDEIESEKPEMTEEQSDIHSLNNEIKKIIVVYSDKTFEILNQRH